MKRGKLLSALLAATLAASMFAGCSQSSKSSRSAGGASSQVNDTGNQQTHKLKIMGTEGWAPCNNWDEAPEYSSFKILQSWLDEAGLEVTWEVIASDQYSVILQTRLSSGSDLPDLAKVSPMDTASLLSLAKQGMILPIDEMINQYDNGNIEKAFTDDYKNVHAVNTAPDGKMYWFSNVQLKYYGDNKDANGSFSVHYRKDWADKLSISEPKTLDEFTSMFKTFQEKDANGNGQADEILCIAPESFENVVAQWFDLVPGTVGIESTDNKVVSPWHSPNIKAYFTYINQLVNEGIIDPSVVGSSEIVTQKMAENKVAGITGYTNWVEFEPQVVAAAPDVQYTPLMPIQAVEGVTPASLAEPGALVWDKFAVTKACKDPEAVIKLMDIVYTDEYGTLTAFGEEGKNFTYVDGVITPIKGLTMDMAKEQRIAEGAMLWNGVLPRVQKVDMRQQVANRDEYKTKVTLDLIDYEKKYFDQLDNFLALPTDEETERINALKTNVDTASTELATKLAFGMLSIDQLDAEVAKLDQMGLTELTEITQNRYDRYLANLPK